MQFKAPIIIIASTLGSLKTRSRHGANFVVTGETVTDNWVVLSTTSGATSDDKVASWQLSVNSSVSKTDSRLAPSQWETSLQSNAVSHWLGANLESALCILCNPYPESHREAHIDTEKCPKCAGSPTFSDRVSKVHVRKLVASKAKTGLPRAHHCLRQCCNQIAIGFGSLPFIDESRQTRAHVI